MSWVKCECGNYDHLNDSYVGRTYLGVCYQCFKKMSDEDKEKYLESPLRWEGMEEKNDR